MAEMKQRKLVMENGSVFVGRGFGSMNEAVCDMVFNTSMVGYQEIVTDPSYTDQMVLMTYPLVGNYGITDEDYESRVLTLGALVVREYCDEPSNFRYTKTLSELLEENGIPGLEGIDTRAVCRMLRDEGNMRGILCDADVPDEEAMKRLKAWQKPQNPVARVSCRKKWYARTPNPRFSVVAIDCGIRHSFIASMNRLGCNVTVVPYDTPAEDILSFKADGLILTNGPGNPAEVTPVIETVRALRGKLPIFGACKGHQLLALACGAKTYQLKCGHHGSNQPVREVATGRVHITTQNHRYCVDAESLEGTGLVLTHVNVLDGTVEGLACEQDRLFSVQFNPTDELFGQFIDVMEEGKRHA